MTGPQLVASSVKNVWAGAIIVATVLVVAGCELPGAEHPERPATPTPAARVVVTPAPTATIELYPLRSSACTDGGRGPMHRYASHDVARWTADGAHILLTYSAEVWAVTPDGSRLWRLAKAWGQTEPGAPFSFGWMTSFDVTWDGKQVVYATCRYPPDVPRAVILGEGGPWAFDYELAMVGLDGQAPRRLTRHPAFDNYPAWSPDGTRIAFLSDGHVSEAEFRRGYRPAPGLHTMAADGADVRRLATGSEGGAFQPPAWSPDGRSIAVAVGSWKFGEGDHALYLVQADGAGFVRLADAAVSGGAWSPDGTRLAFAKPEDAGVALFTIAADGSDAQRVTTILGWQRSFGVPDPNQAWIHTVAWSPDGSKLLYSCGARHFCVVTLDGEPVGATPLTGDRAVWSPDGARIAVTTLPEPRVYNGSILYSAAPDGSDVEPLALGGVGLVAARAKEESLATSRAACAAGFVVPAPDAHPGLVRDCATLLAARAALFGRLLVNWGSGSPLERWEGVTVAGAPPRVTGLDLRYVERWFTRHNSVVQERLSGTIPPELGNLTHLKQLYLAGNWLTGCVPSGLKHLQDNDPESLDWRVCEAGS